MPLSRRTRLRGHRRRDRTWAPPLQRLPRFCIPRQDCPKVSVLTPVELRRAATGLGAGARRSRVRLSCGTRSCRRCRRCRRLPVEGGFAGGREERFARGRAPRFPTDPKKAPVLLFFSPCRAGQSLDAARPTQRKISGSTSKAWRCNQTGLRGHRSSCPLVESRSSSARCCACKRHSRLSYAI